MTLQERILKANKNYIQALTKEATRIMNIAKYVEEENNTYYLPIRLTNRASLVFVAHMLNGKYVISDCVLEVLVDVKNHNKIRLSFFNSKEKHVKEAYDVFKKYLTNDLKLRKEFHEVISINLQFEELDAFVQLGQSVNNTLEVELQRQLDSYLRRQNDINM